MQELHTLVLEMLVCVCFFCVCVSHVLVGLNVGVGVCVCGCVERVVSRYRSVWIWPSQLSCGHAFAGRGLWRRATTHLPKLKGAHTAMIPMDG